MRFFLCQTFFFFLVYEVIGSTTEDTLGFLRVFENGFLKARSNDSGEENMWSGFSNKKVQSAGFQRHALK